ncbi:hypothetical protein ACVT98_26215 (plasmid) [Vibrio campbellii]
MFLFFTLLCFIGGLYGGGAAYYKLTNISLEHLTYHSLFDQWQAYRHNPDIKKFLVIGVAVSIAITLFPTLMAIVIAIASQEKEEIHGSAKFATDMDLANSGLSLTRKPRTRSQASC